MARPRMRRLRLALIAVVLLAGSAAGVYFIGLNHGAQSQSATRKITTTPTCLSKAGRRHGAFCTGVALNAVNKRALAGFTSSTGVFPKIVEYYQAFGRPFSRVDANLIGYLGARPMVQLNPHQIGLSAIVAGRYDTYLKSYAAAVKAFGHQVILSFGHEMNGDWNTWSLPFTKPRVFVAAWRHIVTVFRGQHVHNVTWAWDISHSGKPPKRWWPGNKYVDWVGIDGYVRPNQTFAGQFWRIITTVRRFADKPVLITEVAVAPGSTQVAQIGKLFAGARARHLVGLIWFDVNKLEKWRLVANTPAALAFRRAAEAYQTGAGITAPPAVVDGRST